MSNHSHERLPDHSSEKISLKNKIFAFLIVIAVTYGLLVFMGQLKPEIEKKQEIILTPTVETIQIEPRNFVVPIVSDGMVKPKTSIAFSAEVSGTIISVSEQFVNGGRFKAGDVLLNIDPRDYELAITRAQANVSAQQATLDLEQAKSDLAKADWKKYGKQGTPTALNLNLPQVASAKAGLAGAKADLLLARRNLEKTTIIAPFNGVVLSKNVDVGQFVNTGTMLSTIASTNTAEIRVALSDEQLQKSGLSQSFDDVNVHISSTEVSSVQWLGQVAQIEAQRDEQTLMNYVIVEVQQPFTQQSSALRFNTFVEVLFSGQTLNNVYPLSRNLMTLDQTVNVLDGDSQLRIRSVEVGYSDDSTLYISSGLEKGDQIITTQLADMEEGTQLKLKQ